MNSKHAYLIMAHNNFEQLMILLSVLDDVRNDIYVHIDKKVDNYYKLKEELNGVVEKSKLYFVDRISVTWGGFSQIQCELELIKKAAMSGEYRYFHLLSGADMPLHNQDEIHAFFEKNDGKEFVNYAGKDYIDDVKKRCKYYWLFQEFVGNSKKPRKIVLRKFRGVLLKLQQLFHVNRLRNNKPIFAGSNWFSITNDFAVWVLEKKNWINKTFRFGNCVDELFLQSLLYQSPYYKNCYIKKLENGVYANQRYIDWNRGGPYVWRNEDYEELINSGCMFARKFDQNVDMEIIRRIAEKIKK